MPIEEPVSPIEPISHFQYLSVYGDYLDDAESWNNPSHNSAE